MPLLPFAPLAAALYRQQLKPEATAMAARALELVEEASSSEDVTQVNVKRTLPRPSPLLSHSVALSRARCLSWSGGVAGSGLSDCMPLHPIHVTRPSPNTASLAPTVELRPIPRACGAMRPIMLMDDG